MPPADAIRSRTETPAKSSPSGAAATSATARSGSTATRRRSSSTRSTAASASSERTHNNSPATDRKRAVTADDMHHEYEFGGPVGVMAMMTLFPCLFYYLYVCLYFYDGRLARPVDPSTLTGPGGWIDFVKLVFRLVVTHAAPTRKATTLYFSLISLQLLLALIMPGVQQRGLPVSSLGGKTLVYSCNAYTSLYATIAIVGALHYTRVFNLADIIDLYGPLFTIAQLSGFGLAAIVYITGERYRMSGNIIYDYFMGSSLNPRLGSVDLKMWAEIRVSWMLLFAIAMAACAKQYQTYGYVSANTALFAWGTGLYLNACAKGEQYIPQTWDMNYEKASFGWLLSYWNLAGVPFSYAYSAIYMATHDPKTYSYPTWFVVQLFILLTVSHGLFDVAMGQKSYFKAKQTNTFIKRYTFPQIPGTEIENPKTMKTITGTDLLIDGLWGILRKPNYTFDWFQAVVWGLSAGQGSAIPYFYPLFHITMLLHRNARDNAKCARKYGKSWIEYKQKVPYTYIPYVY
ncbi:BZ3500_MvSof-1268-A1-R1_Chr3-1g05861 [Microbotryum saponariae]|uniref:Delta(24(24(1)))-sterol reductase n=1 Tax=Microbotryum saponariae TaxID=289078 RepID=A0A2X0LDV4_9BASI|nr:BZ3500_MvSof-1268-A1-R1_Chr3-1g05861 [Microbotryum saponariae]SDA05051.1 BZ3501_MvSof-1269-A2-R1_Chr3-1g05531 [Microbotryum saponariae]